MKLKQNVETFFFEHGILPSFLPSLVEGKNIVPFPACREKEDYGRLTIFLKRNRNTTDYTINNMKDTNSSVSLIIRDDEEEGQVLTNEEKRKEEEFIITEPSKRKLLLLYTRWENKLTESLTGRPLNKNDTATFFAQKGLLEIALKSGADFRVNRDRRGEYVAVFFVEEIRGEPVGVQRWYSTPFKLLGRICNKETWFKPLKVNASVNNGSFIPLGNKESNEVIICNGILTGLSLYKDNPGVLVLVVDNAKNLSNVAQKFKGKEVKIIYGIYQTKEAAKLDGTSVLPLSVDKPDSFNGYQNDVNINNPAFSLRERVRKIFSRILSRKVSKLSKGDIILMNSPIGSGKTSIVADLTRFDSRVIVISPSVSSVYYNVKKFDRPNYKKTMNDPRGYVVCIDSLTNLTESDQPSTVVFEEIEQTLDHLVLSPGIRNKSEKIFNVLIKALQEAEKVFCLDAFLREETINLIKRITGKEPVFWEGQKVEPKNNNAHVYSSETSLLQILYEKVRNGDPVYVCVNKNEKAQRIRSKLSRIFPDKRIVLFSWADRNGFNDFSSNPNAFLEAMRPDVVLVSPSFSSSFSIEIEYFKAVFGFFRNGVNRASDCLQQIGRVRPSVPLFLCMSEGKKLDLKEEEMYEAQRVLNSPKYANKAENFLLQNDEFKMNTLWEKLFISRRAGFKIDCENIYDGILDGLKQKGLEVSIYN